MNDIDGSPVDTSAPAIVPKSKQKYTNKNPHSTYQAMVRKYLPILGQIEEVQTFRLHKSDILSAAQRLVLKFALDENKLRKASFYSLCQGFEILNKIERLELNKSTENIAHGFGKLDNQDENHAE